MRFHQTVFSYISCLSCMFTLGIYATCHVGSCCSLFTTNIWTSASFSSYCSSWQKIPLIKESLNYFLLFSCRLSVHPALFNWSLASFPSAFHPHRDCQSGQLTGQWHHGQSVRKNQVCSWTMSKHSTEQSRYVWKVVISCFCIWCLAVQCTIRCFCRFSLCLNRWAVSCVCRQLPSGRYICPPVNHPAHQPTACYHQELHSHWSQLQPMALQYRARYLLCSVSNYHVILDYTLFQDLTGWTWIGGSCPRSTLQFVLYFHELAYYNHSCNTFSKTTLTSKCQYSK